MSNSLTPKARLEALLALINSAAHDAISEYERVGEVPSIDTVHPLDTISASLTLRKAVRVMEGACEQLVTTLAPPAHTLLKRSFSHLEPTCLEVAIEANVAGILADHPDGLSIADIGTKAGIRPEWLGRFVRLLATNSCFKEVRKDVFQNNRLSSRLVAHTPLSDYFLLISREVRFQGAYAWLTDPTLGLSESPNKAPLFCNIEGSNFYEWLKNNPDREALFGSAMVGVNEAYGDSDMLVGNFPFDRLPVGATFCDVAGGIGGMCVGIANTYPHMNITLQDQPRLVEQGRQFLDARCPEAARAKRINVLPLDFFKESPVKDQDIYYLRNILHNWTDSDAILILKSIRRAMKPESRILLHEQILGSSDPEEPSMAPDPLPANYGAGSILPYYHDLNMMNIFTSKERSPEEYRALGVAAGLEFVKLWDLVQKSLVEFKLPG